VRALAWLQFQVRKTLRKGGHPVPLSRAFNSLIFAFWVSVGAAAPEFIWRGLVALAGHLAWRDVYSAIVIAMLLGPVRACADGVLRDSWCAARAPPTLTLPRKGGGD
jgi:hypothetical protein